MQDSPYKLLPPSYLEEDHIRFDTAESANKGDYALAHPYRIQKFTAEFPKQYRMLLGEKEWAPLEAAFHSDDFILANITLLCREKGMHRTEGLIGIAAWTPGSTEVGGAMPMLAGLRHLVAPYRIFRVDDDLVDLLNLTDVAEDIPVSMLKMPFQRCYVELGTKRETGFFVRNEESGMHALEGAYLEVGEHPLRGRGLYVMFTGSPLGKSNVLDDATSSIFLSLKDPERLIQDELRDALNEATTAALEAGLRAPLRDDGAEQNIQLICKALLYIGMPDIRKTVSLKRTELKAQVERLKSPGKRAKAERQLQRVSDEIWIHAPAGQLTPAQAAVSSGAGVTPHWRRGHYRNQRYGAQLAFTKLVFIAPVLVNGSGADAAASSTKNYRVS